MRRDQQRRVCVVGAGVSGLTVARELESVGHAVTVLEAAPSVGGKCASVTIDGHAFDVGGHVCTVMYQRLAALVTELGLSTENVMPVTQQPFLPAGVLHRYAALRTEQFPDIAQAGLAHSARALAMPVRQWLAGLPEFETTFGLGYTSSGYGRLDGDLPALYLVKYAEMTGLLSDRRSLLGHTGPFTVAGGFGQVWDRVAAELTDVRCGATISAIRRHGTRVLVTVDGTTFQFDDLVLTVPLDQLLPVLDAREDERDIASRIRYHSYRTTFCSSTGQPRQAFTLYGDISFHHRYADSDVYACYSYDPACVARPIAERRWKYMPHFGSADLAAGIYDRVEALQGRHRTYHVGSLPAFELVECTLDYAREFVARHFGSDLRDWLTRRVSAEVKRPVDPHAPIATLGLESLSMATVLADLSARLGYRVPNSLLLELSTVDAVARHLDEHGAEVARPRSLALALTPPRPFFCVGGAVGAAYYLLPLARAIGQLQTLYALQSPGFDGVEEPLDEVPALARRYVEEIKAIQPHGPYLVGGHSFGGLVAYEIGRVLRSQGDEVAQVILIDTYLAEPGQPEPPPDDVAVIEELWRMRGLALRGADAPRRRVDQKLSPAEQRRELARFLGASGPADEHIATIMGVYQAQLEAVVRYEPGPSDLDVTLIKAEDGFPQVLFDDRHIALRLEDPANGWERVELGRLSVITVPGNHFTALAPPALTSLATAVTDTIAAIPAPLPPESVQVASSIHLNPMDPHFLADPYPFYHLLRDIAPIHRDEALDGWVLTRHAEVSALLRNQKVVRPSTSTLLARLPATVLQDLRPFVDWLDSSLPFSNHRHHDRLRRLLAGSFTAKAMEALRSDVEQTVHEMLDRIDRPGPVEFMSEVAYPLPGRVVMDLVGVPRDDQPMVADWGRTVMTVLGQAQFGEDPTAVAYQARDAATELIKYVRGLTLSPQLASGWAGADERVANVISLINAGLETTANYLGNSVLALLRHPEQFELLHADPSIARTAAEELLRYDTPAPIITPQQALQDLDLGGHRIRAGELVFPVLGAANRDPARYPDPDRLDLRRPDAAGHLTFGAGAHYCIGAALARIEGQVFFPTLATRFPGMRLVAEPVFRPDPALRGLAELAVLPHG
ncbi:cytochrome P450 [Kutzneria sp. CA-103260]|uniref:cytochrome P450 n=1 Tax=Kutzneria sp. CA-103260 TaxID=2802641 RepID=UPI001BAAECC5|nr:cytochrome P450 [Kutzneria sp. CA-103260]QUQ65097.1 Renalase [Kutzneria sp. CA-103260]